MQRYNLFSFKGLSPVDSFLVYKALNSQTPPSLKEFKTPTQVMEGELR